MIGEHVLGYRVDEVVGSGSFGTVYKVSKTNASGTYVRALKHIKLPATKQQYNSVLNSMGGDYSKADDYFAAALKEIVDEIRILSMLSESGVTNIVRYYENDIIETSHPKTYNIYMMMEYLTPFPEIIETRTMSMGEVIRVGKDILKALISCHQKNIIHRDIKDDNIFVTKDGVYKLGDFGVSKKLQDKSRAASMRGTPNFIAPEVYLGKESYDCTVDLYSLGIVLYRLLNRLRGPFLPTFPAPYTSEDENAAFEARMSGKTPELPLMAQNRLGEVVCKAIMPRAQRYNSAQEFLEALEQAEASMSREEWLAPAYEVFISENEADTPKQPKEMSIPDGDKTVGGLLFDTNEEEPIRVEQNLFMTMGADRTNLPPKEEMKEPVSIHLQEEKQEDLPIRQTEEINNFEPAAQPTPEKPRKIKKSTLITIIAACAVCLIAAVVIGVTAIVDKTSPLVICGKTVAKSETSIYLSDVTVTAEDMEAMAELEELKYITMTDCSVSNEAMAYIKEMAPTLRDIELTNCTGITDFSSIGTVENLVTLTLDNVNLTDEQLSMMFPTAPVQLYSVDLSNNPSLTDLSGLAEATTLENLRVSNTAVQDFSALQNCTGIFQLWAQNCGISDLSSLTALTSLDLLDLGYNQISNVSGIGNLTKLHYLYLNHNQIADLNGLQQLADLWYLNVSENQITDLSPLSGLQKLDKLYANSNSLTDLDGLEQAISLIELEVADNQLLNIEGICNCTILEKVDLSYNMVEDISILSKSAGTMSSLYFHQNEVKDISALSGLTNLKTLCFDGNYVDSLDALAQMESLEVLSAAHNEIESIEGLKNANNLQSIYLENNMIKDMTPIADLSASSEYGISILDLSHNQITELALSPGQQYNHLSVYDNPIISFQAATEVTGNKLYLSYVENGEYSTELSESFTYCIMTDCPLDQQYAMNQAILGVDYLSPYLEFVDADELDERLYAEKYGLN